MSKSTFTLEEGAIMLDALDALKQYKMTDYSLARTNALQMRIANGFPAFTLGELKNICLGLEVLLSGDPMDWKANTLLQRLRTEFGVPKQL